MMLGERSTPRGSYCCPQNGDKDLCALRISSEEKEIAPCINFVTRTLNKLYLWGHLPLSCTLYPRGEFWQFSDLFD